MASFHLSLNSLSIGNPERCIVFHKRMPNKINCKCATRRKILPCCGSPHKEVKSNKTFAYLYTLMLLKESNLKDVFCNIILLNSREYSKQLKIYNFQSVATLYIQNKFFIE